MEKIKAKKIATWIIVPFMIGIFVFDIITVVLANKYADRYPVYEENFDGKYSDDRIHFLNTANSDCIIIESNGHFAMIDSGEGDSNPRRSTEYRGYEKDVLEYLKSHAVSGGGKVTLDFILGTHMHYDHVGCFHAIITDKDIEIKKAYFKPYNQATDKGYEISRWKLPEIYDQIINDLESEGIPLISDLPDKPFRFGDLTLQFYNTVTSSDFDGEGENAQSVGVKITKGGKTVFLAADITYTTGLEQSLYGKIGDVDLLKAGHHGYFGSSSLRFLRELKPEICIITNQLGKIYPDVKWKLVIGAQAAVYATYDRNGIIANLTDDGQIILTENIHRKTAQSEMSVQ